MQLVSPCIWHFARPSFGVWPTEVQETTSQPESGTLQDSVNLGTSIIDLDGKSTASLLYPEVVVLVDWIEGSAGEMKMSPGRWRLSGFLSWLLQEGLLGHRRDLSSTVYPGHKVNGRSIWIYLYSYFLNSLTSTLLASALFDSYLFPGPLETGKIFFIFHYQARK